VSGQTTWKFNQLNGKHWRIAANAMQRATNEQSAAWCDRALSRNVTPALCESNRKQARAQKHKPSGKQCEKAARHKVKVMIAHDTPSASDARPN
jgi:hypothetical protein